MPKYSGPSSPIKYCNCQKIKIWRAYVGISLHISAGMIWFCWLSSCYTDTDCKSTPAAGSELPGPLALAAQTHRRDSVNPSRNTCRGDLRSPIPMAPYICITPLHHNSHHKMKYNNGLDFHITSQNKMAFSHHINITKWNGLFTSHITKWNGLFTSYHKMKWPFHITSQVEMAISHHITYTCNAM